MSTSTTRTNLPDYIKDPITKSLGQIEDWLGSDENYVYGTKEGEQLYTGLSDMQQEALGNTDWLADQDLADMFGISKAESFFDDFGNYDPAELTPERIVDEDGYTGAISDYINPYLAEVLDPQIRNLEEATQRRLNDIGSSAAMSGSFGDARHAIGESLAYQDRDRAIGDVTGQAHQAAWNNAMALRGNDLTTKYGIEAGNRAAEMEQSGRKAQAGSAIAGLGDQYFDLFMDTNDALYNAGEIEREAEIERQETMRAFQEAISGKRYNDALKLLMAAQGTPYEQTSTTEQQSDNDGFWGLLGAGLGALF